MVHITDAIKISFSIDNIGKIKATFILSKHMTLHIKVGKKIDL